MQNTQLDRKKHILLEDTISGRGRHGFIKVSLDFQSRNELLLLLCSHAVGMCTAFRAENA